MYSAVFPKGLYSDEIMVNCHGTTLPRGWHRTYPNFVTTEAVKGMEFITFEQELLFYLEKLDINEEKVRLVNHCNYFTETLDEPTASGKKLGFIAQEIGREINTLGSKANHSDIQKIVIIMKDELEKIKEQTLNVL